MSVLSFLDRIKFRYLVLASLVIILFKILVNTLLVSENTLHIVNAVFEVLISVLISSALLVLYFVSHKNNFVISRTIMWLGITMVGWAIGDALYLYMILIKSDPFISFVDVFYIASYLLMIVALLTLPDSQPATRRRYMVFLEISILTLSAVVIFTTLLLVPGKPAINFNLITMLMVFIYPVLDVILIWVIMILYFTYSVNSTRSVLRMLFAAAFSVLLSDLFYMFMSLYETQFNTYLVDLGYYLFYVFLFFGGFLGFKMIRTRELIGEENAAVYKHNNWIVFIPGVFLIIVIGLLLVFVFNQSFVLPYGIIALMVLIISLFIIHQYIVLIANIKLTRGIWQINAQLESKVALRTAELSKINVELQDEIKERGKAEAHLEKSHKDLALLNRDKDKLFSILAHDLRSPLGSMMNLSALLVENINDFDESELMEAIVALNKSATQTYQLLNDLLTWSTIQMGRSESVKTVFPISEIISEIVDSLTPDTLRKQIEILSDVDPVITVFADKFAIQTVLRNLVHNAIKFTPNHERVFISAENIKNNVKISIIDNGIGISKERQKKIFKVDTISSYPGTDGEKGTGFGLILCKDLIDSNGGEIGFESEEGKGSIFYFTLPVHSEQDTLIVIQKENPVTRIEYKFDSTRKLGFTSLFGNFNTETLKVELNQLWASDQFNPNYSVLIDIRKATFSGDNKDISEFFKIFMAIPGNQTNRKFAVLTATPHQVAYSTMFGQFIKSYSSSPVEVFSTYEAAMTWLGS